MFGETARGEPAAGALVPLLRGILGQISVPFNDRVELNPRSKPFPTAAGAMAPSPDLAVCFHLQPTEGVGERPWALEPPVAASGPAGNRNQPLCRRTLTVPAS